MPASIRIIKIVKDKNPISGEEEEAYTAEIECESEDAKGLAKELSSCPYGKQIMDLLERAKFIPEKQSASAEELAVQAKKEELELNKREEELREEGRKEVREKYVKFLKDKRMKRASETLDTLAKKENKEADKKAKDEEERIVEQEENPENSQYERDEQANHLATRRSDA